MKKATKKLITIMLCLVLTAAVFSACSTKKETTVTPTPTVAQTETKVETGMKGSSDETYYMVVMVSGVEYWFPVYEMFKQAGKELGVKTVYTGTPDYDVNKEIAVFEQTLAKKPAGIYVHPMNADAFVEPINKAIDSGVPVATFAADSPKSKRRVYITSDNKNEAYVASEAVCKEIGDAGEIALTENPGQSNHDLYIKSFIANVEKNHPNVKIVNRTATNQDTAKAYQTALSVMQAHPNLKAYITPEAPSAQGVAQAVREKGGKVLILTRDLNIDILNSIKAGEIYGAVNPDQGTQGFMGLMTLFLMKHSDMLDFMSDYKLKGVNPLNLPFVDNGMNIVTKENADGFYWDKYLQSRPGSKGIEE